MSNTRFARPITLRMDAQERQALMRCVMNDIEDKSKRLNTADAVTPDQVAYVRTLRSLLERLTD